jgi:toxin YoeB
MCIGNAPTGKSSNASICSSKESQRAPCEGIGKPEPLKHGMVGYWSWRITDEHRMVYKVEVDALCIAQLRYHY